MKLIYLLYLVLLVSLSGCDGCSKSARKQQLNNGTSERKQNNRESRNDFQGKTVVQMEKNNGVYQVPIYVNGVKMFFIFDTGASTISISETEAIFLYKQGSLEKDDILGTANFIDANGDISEGTIINLKTVKIGNRTLRNIKASVVHNLNAPLLLGQSALEEFGKISIDNKRGVITFE